MSFYSEQSSCVKTSLVQQPRKASSRKPTRGAQGKKTEKKLQEKCNFNLIFFDFSRYKITIEPKENIKFF